MFSYLQQYHHTRRRPVLLLRFSLSTVAGVMHERAKGSAAEALILARVQNELVP